MNDILPPQGKRPQIPPAKVPTAQIPPSKAPLPEPQLLPVADRPKQLLLTAPKRRHKVIWWLLGVALFLGVAAGGGVLWYNQALSPVKEDNKNRVRLEIPSGASPTEIGQLLEQKGIIRNHVAFDIYTRLSNTRSSLQAGTYSLSPSEPVPAIVNHLVAGNIDQVSITFLPGATLAQNRTGLINAGYSEAEVDAALKKSYTHPLFKDKPASSDLEGYIYGETYNFSTSATVEEVLKTTFDHFYEVIEKNNLITAFEAQKLTLYEGITLASVIQREVSGAEDQKKVAQVFLRRLAIGMPLGSDVTYQYAAKKMGVTPSPLLDSPYNTRRYGGLPPGPIATPGVTALLAVAQPAEGDFLYFLSGDDDITYFARTDEEHQANIRNHCQKKCLLP